MREFALVALNAAAVLPGFALLELCGLPTRSPWATGLAYLSGVAALLLVQIMLLPLGVPVSPAVLAATAVVLCGAALVRRKRAEPSHEDRDETSPQRYPKLLRAAAGVGLGVLGATMLFGVLSAHAVPLIGFDAWAQWVPKAELLAHHNLVAGSLWGSPSYTYVNPDYPLVLPVFEADQLRVVGIGYGSPDLPLLQIGSWLFLAAFLAAVVHLCRRRVGVLVLVPLVLFFGAAPGIQLQAREVLADLPLAVFISLGALLLVAWVEQRRPGLLVVGTLFLAVGANTKDEGTAAAFLVGVVTLWVVAARRDRGGVIRILVVLSIIALAVAPWRIWLAVHGIHGVISLQHGFDPGYLLGHVSRVRQVLNATLGALARPGEYLLLPAASLALIVVALAGRGAGRWRARYYLALLIGYFAIVVGAEWVSSLPIAFYLPDEDRYVTTAAALSLVALIDLAPSMVAALHLKHVVARVGTPGTRRSP